MKKRKHRVVVDVSFAGPVTERYAAKALQLVLDDSDKERSLQHWPTEIVKTDAKEGQRALQQMIRKELEFRSLSPFAGYQAPQITENDGHLLAAAVQAGAVLMNDDGTVYAYREEDLLRLIHCAFKQDFSSLWDKEHKA